MEPRIFGSPNGGILNVSVSLLQLGLSRCRSVAEAAQSTGEYAKGCAEIIEIVRSTLHEIEEYEVTHEVEVELNATNNTNV